jgi:hypothetical protein
MLLLGVFMCVLLSALQALSPSYVTCAMTRLGVGLAYAIVFATLLVKSVFLISLNGGVYLPAPYQALLLLFAVLIQVRHSFPTHTNPLCSYRHTQLKHNKCCAFHVESHVITKSDEWVRTAYRKAHYNYSLISFLATLLIETNKRVTFFRK